MTEAQELLANHHKYEVVRDISSGSFGRVVLCRNKRNGKHVAIKFMPRSSSRNSKFVEREAVAHSCFCHPHVIQFKEIFLTKDHLAIAMEYAAGGDLFHYVKAKGGLQESEARWLFQQLVVALDYCHKMGVVNRDVKLENTLLDSNSAKPLLKLTDFGYCKTAEDSSPKTLLGSFGYTAPEVIGGDPTDTYNGAPADIWSAGVMLYLMLFCQYPFERADDDQHKDAYQRVVHRITQGKYHLPASKHISAECADLLAHILVVDPEKRFTVAQIQAHPWYLKNLPRAVLTMNEECIQLKPHEYPGYQSVESILSVIRAC